jgi:putative Mg2+ transporter-C (MgtC) family protein
VLGDLDYLEAAERIGMALLLGAIIGLQREWQNKPAGLRTYALVSEGAALFMVASLLLGAEAVKAGNTHYDPSRIGSTIVQGIGFLAAGVIFSRRGEVRGLTSAAAIWVTAAIGMLAGSGFYAVAAIATGATFIVLSVLREIERLTSPRRARDDTSSSRSD